MNYQELSHKLYSCQIRVPFVGIRVVFISNMNYQELAMNWFINYY